MSYENISINDSPSDSEMKKWIDKKNSTDIIKTARIIELNNALIVAGAPLRCYWCQSKVSSWNKRTIHITCDICYYLMSG